MCAAGFKAKETSNIMTKTALHRSRVSSHLSGKNGQAAGELRSLISEAKASLSNAGENATENLSALKDRLSDSLVSVKAKVKAFTKSARRQASRADDSIRTNPYQAMGIAAGLGFIAGLLIARRRSAR
jgi:ElaB/YqjD/DUF883 family membrane-anchored ribosome-binding protein